MLVRERPRLDNTDDCDGAWENCLVGNVADNVLVGWKSGGVSRCAACHWLRRRQSGTGHASYLGPTRQRIPQRSGRVSCEPSAWKHGVLAVASVTTEVIAAAVPSIFTAVGVDGKSGLARSLFLLRFAHPVVNQVTEGLSILLSTYLLRYLSI